MCTCMYVCMRTYTYLLQYNVTREIPEKLDTMLFELLASKTMKLEPFFKI